MARRRTPSIWPQDVVLARPMETLPRHPGLLYEPKWDGYRALIHID